MRYTGSRLKANALKGKRLLCQNRKDCHRLGCDLDLAYYFACLINDAHAGRAWHSFSRAPCRARTGRKTPAARRNGWLVARAYFRRKSR